LLASEEKPADITTVGTQPVRQVWNCRKPMKILYLDPLRQCGSVKSMLVRAGHRVTCVTEPEEAIELIGKNPFSAVLIAEEVRNSAALEFISDVHRERPELLVFPLKVWRSDLADELERLETIGLSDDTPQA
jgi:PleD family two-component response regulator